MMVNRERFWGDLFAQGFLEKGLFVGRFFAGGLFLGFKALLIIGLSIALFYPPGLAFAEPTVTETVSADGASTETKYSWREGEDPPLLGAVPVIDKDYVAPTKFYTHELTQRVAVEDINRLEQVIPQSYLATDGDFIGQIGLDLDNPYTIQPVYETQTAQVDKLEVITGLPDNDAVRLAQTHSYTVRSSAAPGATQTVDLVLSSVEYELAGTSELGRPNNWTAYLGYRGVEDFLVIVAYDVTAHYAGEIVDSVPQYAAYTTTVIPAATLEIADAETPLATVLATSAGVVTVLALGALALWLLAFRKNISLLKVVGDKEMVLYRRYLRVHGGFAELTIPDAMEVFTGHTQHALILKPSLANKQGFLRVIWRGHVIAQENLKERVELGNEFIMRSSASIFSELLVEDGEAASHARD